MYLRMTKNKIVGYYILQKDGQLTFHKENTINSLSEALNKIGKENIVSYWPINYAYRKTLWIFLIESLALGGHVHQIMRLAKRWNCDSLDAKKFAYYSGIEFKRNGNKFQASIYSQNQQHLGTGNNPVTAFKNLAISLQLTPSKTKLNRFEALINGSHTKV